jgi:hypothetical protein
MKKLAVLAAWLVLATAALRGQSGDVLGMHDLSFFGPGPVNGGLPACQFCHAPHSGLDVAPLWGQKLSTVSNYTLYSGTITNTPTEPAMGSPSNLCLSCHDGTVAPGQSIPSGAIKMQGSMSGQDVFGRNLSSVHPFNFDLSNGGLQCTSNMFVCQGTPPSNPAVKLIAGNVQCETCHDPHVQGIDPVAQQFLVMNNANSAMCLTCHVNAPTSHVMEARRLHAGSAIRLNGNTPSAATTEYSPFTAWSKSAHALAVNKTAKAANVGSYGNVRENGCLSCHTPHRAPGGQPLLAGPSPAVPNMDAATQNCILCHNGGSNLSPAIPNVFAEFAKTGHPFPAGSNQHLVGESLTLNHNRHATCVDCHDPHASAQTGSFTATTIRPAQAGVTGVSAADGITPVSPAVNQYETCLRCHVRASRF